MLSQVQLSNRSIELLQRRDLSSKEIGDFSRLLDKAHSNGGSAKEILQGLSSEELKLLQKANSLAGAIDIGALSEEGATNLLSQPDNSDKVDLNNDGLVEVGEAKTIIFPPVNAPDYVKAAWLEATADMPEKDKMLLQLNLHTAIYGIHIDGIEQPKPLSPQQQWSKQGIEDLFVKLRSNLDFRVGMEGWTDHNKMLKGFYDRFEQSMQGQGAFAACGLSVPATQGEGQAGSSEGADSQTQEKTQAQSKQQTLMQLLLDARMGVDRKKLEEIDEKIKAIENDDSMDDEQKQKLIEALEQKKEIILKQAQQRMVETEKRKQMLSQQDNMVERLKEDELRFAAS